MKKKTNLKKVYEDIYNDGKEKFFSRFVDNKDISENDDLVLKCVDWNGKTVIDFGCGTGETAFSIAKLGAKRVYGIDFSESAIEKAKNNYKLTNLDFFVEENLSKMDPVDCIVSCGTLEHLDDPRIALMNFTEKIKIDGSLVLTCPYFINIKGFVWMTLALTLDVPMSLTDKHFISPFDFIEWLKGTDYELKKVVPFDYDRANGEIMIDDMRKRLNNALRDRKLPTKGVEPMLAWLEKLIKYKDIKSHNFGGSNCLYVIAKNDVKSINYS
jgi:2-polyprenyl-3-methyl-5-hydroxy-6-metoxy-1,4-benzoquinol methylase